MLAIFAILLFSAYLVFLFPLESKEKKEEKSPKYTAQMKKLWQVAQTSMRERKPFRAEKALLTILKFDKENAAAYNRLGILYAKGQKYDEAVECFEIAQSLDNNPASIHNVGLIYLETGAYEKAAMAFNQAIELEGDVPARFIALAKAEEKLGRYKKAVEALENAYELDPKVSTLRQILAIHEETADTEAATATSARIEEQVALNNETKKRRMLANLRRGATVCGVVTPETQTSKHLRGKYGIPTRRAAEQSTRKGAVLNKKTKSGLIAKPNSRNSAVTMRSHSRRKKI